MKGIEREIDRVHCDLKILLSSLCVCRDLQTHENIVKEITDKEYRLKILQQNSSQMSIAYRGALNEYKLMSKMFPK